MYKRCAIKRYTIKRTTIVFKFYEAKASRLTRILMSHQGYILRLSKLCKMLSQLRFGCRQLTPPIKISRCIPFTVSYYSPASRVLGDLCPLFGKAGSSGTTTTRAAAAACVAAGVSCGIEVSGADIESFDCFSSDSCRRLALVPVHSSSVCLICFAFFFMIRAFLLHLSSRP